MDAVPIRRVEMVWRELNALGSSGPLLHSASHAVPSSRTTGKRFRLIPAIYEYIKGVRVDRYGMYKRGPPPMAAHWALRVEIEPGEGLFFWSQTWQYLGLIRTENGDCALDETPFDCPDGRDKKWDFGTSHDIEHIKGEATQLVLQAGKYDLFRNNCQGFVKSLRSKIKTGPAPKNNSDRGFDIAGIADSYWDNILFGMTSGWNFGVSRNARR